MKNKPKIKSAFTIIELLVVVVLVSLIAAFAIPSFNKSMRKSYERDIITQLQAIHAANLTYRAINYTFYIKATGTLDDINTNLRINILADSSIEYIYKSADGVTFTIDADYNGIGDPFTVIISQTGALTCVPVGDCPTI